MISRIFRTSIVVIALGSVTVSCTDFLRGKPEKKETIVVEKESLSCLKQVATQFKNLLKSEASEKDVDASFACLDKTLSEFQNRVEGRSDAHSFTAEELHEIFERFLKDVEVSREATTDLLVLKTAILGGSNDKITKKEISDLRNFLSVLKPELKALIPYAKIFAFKKGDTAYLKSVIKGAFDQLNLSLKKLIKVTYITRSDYRFEDFKRLVTHLNVIEGEKNNLMELASKVKNLLVGNYTLQTEADYYLFVDNLTEILRLYSTQVQGNVKFEISTGSHMNTSIEYIQSWLVLLENSVQYKNKQTIALDSLNPLIEEIAAQGILPVQIQGTTLVEFYKMLIVRVFESGRHGDIAKITGLSQVHFTNLKREIAIYRLYMEFINAVAVDDVRIPIKSIQTQLRQYNPKAQESILKSVHASEHAKVLRSFDELRNEFLSARPVVYRFKKMVIANNQEVWDQNWEDLARGFYAKMLARQLLIGWGMFTPSRENPTGYASKEVSHSHLTEDALVQWYAEFRQFGIETKAFDPRSVNSGAESFKQADLLTFSADGDGKMNFFETVQYVNLLVSGGGQTLSEIRAGLGRAGCNLTEKDAFDYVWNNEACAIDDLRKNFKFYFSNLSWLTAFVERLNDQQFVDFYSQLMDVTRFDARFKGIQIETVDLRSMSIILHYIESLFSTFDKNSNGTLSESEIRTSYVRFKAFAKSYAFENSKAQIDEFNGLLGRTVYGCYSEEDLIRESFIFLVYNGKTPTKNNLSTLPCIWGLRKPLIKFSAYAEVDRKTVINTFKILKAVLGSKK